MSVDAGGDFRVTYNFVAPYLDGVYLLVNAVPDSFLVYDAHDCGYYKAEKIAGNHDLFSDLLRWDSLDRVVRTHLETKDYIMGADDKLSKKLLQIGRRYRPAIIFVARSNIVITTGHNAGPILRDLGRKLEAPLVVIPDKHQDRDYITGYQDGLGGLLDQIQYTGEPDPKRVLVVGHLFDRHEGDWLGNVQELERMLVGIGAQVEAVFPNGGPFAQLSGGRPPGAVIDLAGATGWTGATRFAERWGGRYLSTPLPMGLGGTEAWLEQVGAFLELEPEAHAFIEAEQAALVPLLQWILPRYFFGKSVLVFGDYLVLGPLLAFLEELGLRIAGVGCTSVATDDSPLPVEVTGPVVPPQLPALRAFVQRALADGELDLVLGNSIIHQNLVDLGVPLVELGYPSVFHHVLNPAPTLGFTGVRVLIERMINALDHPTHQVT